MSRGKNSYSVVVQFSDCNKINKTELAREVAIACNGIKNKLKARQFMTYGMEDIKK